MYYIQAVYKLKYRQALFCVFLRYLQNIFEIFTKTIMDNVKNIDVIQFWLQNVVNEMKKQVCN